MRHVVVIGGGLAGMSAAEALARGDNRDLRITLLEARQFTGGRAGSFTQPGSGETVDYCQHVAMGCCTNLLSLMKRCGLEDQWLRHRELTFLHPDHPPSRFKPSAWLPAPLHLVSPLASLRYLSWEQRRSIAKAMWQLFRTPGEALKEETAHCWLRKAGQDERTLEAFWDVVLVSALGEQPAAVSMASARQVFVEGFAAAKGASDVLIPRRPLRELFAERMPEVLMQRGVELHTGIAVNAIGADPTPVIETTSGMVQADAVVLAVPWHALEKLEYSSPHVKEALMPTVRAVTQFPASPITGVHLWFDREITTREHAVLVGTTSQWLFRQPWQQEGDDAGEYYYQVVISASGAARSLDRETLVGTVVDELRRLFPEARRARCLRTRVVTDPRAVFSIRPEVDAIRPDPSTALPWLSLAGDWVATGWPSTMEGAVISGQLAARQIGHRVGAPVTGPHPGLPKGWLARILIR